MTRRCRTPERDWHESDIPFDENLEKLAQEIRRKQDSDDDSIILAVGETGTGKSTLMLHLGTLVSGENFTINNIGIDKPSFSKALNYTKEQECQYKTCLNDEADVSKRAALTKYNRSLLSLYFAIRGKRIGHLWCNPSLDMLDKPFIEERINGIIHVTTKSKDKPRIYYYYRKDEIISIFEKYKNLKLKTMYKVRKKYATYRGWFRDYDGELKKSYLKKKSERMDAVMDDFDKDFGEKYDDTDQDKEKAIALADKIITTYKPSQVSKKLNCTVDTVNRIADSKLELGVHYFRSEQNHRRITDSGLLKLQEVINGVPMDLSESKK